MQQRFISTENSFDRLNSELDSKPMQGRRKSAARHFGGKAHVSLITITAARFFIPVNNDCDSEPTRTIQEPGNPVTYQNVR